MTKTYHFIGIGGIGMGALAALLLKRGCRVTGSDIRRNGLIEDLISQGAEIVIGHTTSIIDAADVVIRSSAITTQNVEVQEAKRLGKTLIDRAILLALLMEEHIGVTVAGAHGKTTTSSMVAHLLQEAGKEPTMAVGGLIPGTSCNARLGQGKYFVAELDESDGSFLHFSPTYSIITNMDHEHLDHYGNWENLVQAYRQFISQTHPNGKVIACGEDQALMSILEYSDVKVCTYGIEGAYDVQAVNLQNQENSFLFDCFWAGHNLGTIQLKLPGRHNILNALACITLGLELQIEFSVMAKSLADFKGVRRRFDWVGSHKDIAIIDDYAHHPTEIRATLEAARQLKPQRLIALFQPHRYSRVQQLWQEFCSCWGLSDVVIVTDIYAASEQPIEGITAEVLSREMQKQETGTAITYASRDEVVDVLAAMCMPGDMVLALGAGDVTQMSQALWSRLGPNSNLSTPVKVPEFKLTKQYSIS